MRASKSIHTTYITSFNAGFWDTCSHKGPDLLLGVELCQPHDFINVLPWLVQIEKVYKVDIIL